MNDTASLSRRQFLRSTGQAAASSFAPALLSAASPGNTIGVGCIGLGTRGGDLIDAVAHAPNVKVVAVSDVYGPHRQKGIQRSLNPEAKACVDYRELLADRNVDAVVIATPDHWHCQMVLDAVKAGKDIYCEKGFSRTLAEAKLMRDALKKSKLVFQLGHHARQATCALQAKEQPEIRPAQRLRAGQDAEAAQSHGGLGKLHSQPRDAQMLDRRSLRRNCDLPHVPGVPAATPHGALGRCAGGNCVKAGRGGNEECRIMNDEL